MHYCRLFLSFMILGLDKSLNRDQGMRNDKAWRPIDTSCVPWHACTDDRTALVVHQESDAPNSHAKVRIVDRLEIPQDVHNPLSSAFFVPRCPPENLRP